MWNSYWASRPRRNLPEVNYRDSSEDEDDFDSPLVSPSGPRPTREGSPVELAIPTLGDNVDEELEAVSQVLRNVGHSHTFRGTTPHPGTRSDPDGVDQPEVGAGVEDEVEVVEGLVVQEAEQADCADPDNMPNQAVNFEDEAGEDGAKAIDYTRTLKIEYDPQNVKFWFIQLETEMS